MTAGLPVATMRALAKLTLSLRVTGVRDDGLHLIDAEMVTIDLHDTLTIEPGDRLTITGPRADDAPAGAGNLVRRALAAVGRTAAVTLDKHIRAGGGLGGGSSDAAAILRWAGCDDLAIATALGADVPFCLAGGRARVRGIGHEVAALPFEARTFTLLTPPFGCSTVAVYRAWDALDADGRAVLGPNDLEQAALAVEPRLAPWRDRLGDATGLTPTLAGSGSTWFVEGAFPGDDRVVTRTDRP